MGDSRKKIAGFRPSASHSRYNALRAIVALALLTTRFSCRSGAPLKPSLTKRGTDAKVPHDLTGQFRNAVKLAVLNKSVLLQQGPEGPTIIAEHRPDALTASVAVWVKAGSRCDAEGKEGTAHLLEHLLFRRASDNGMSAVFGADINAFTTPDFTFYFCTVTADRGGVVLRDLLRMVFGFRTAEEAVNSEKAVVAREFAFWNQNPLVLVLRSVWGKLGFSADFKSLVIGTPESIRNIDSEDVEDFYRKHYFPDDAVVVVSGDLRPLFDDLNSSLAIQFESVAFESEKCAKQWLNIAMSRDMIRFKTFTDRIYAAVVVLTGGWQTAKPEDMAVTKELLFNSANSRLAISLIEEYQITDNLFSLEDLGVTVPLTFPDIGVTAAVIIAPPESRDELLSVLERVPRQLSHIAVTDDEMLTAIRQAALTETLRLQSPHSRALFLISEYMAGRPRSIRQYLESLSNLTPGEARKNLKAFSETSSVFTITVEPAEGAEKIWAALKFLLFGTL